MNINRILARGMQVVRGRRFRARFTWGGSATGATRAARARLALWATLGGGGGLGGRSGRRFEIRIGFWHCVRRGTATRAHNTPTTGRTFTIGHARGCRTQRVVAGCFPAV